jgi:creatinine amidohydrolase/Fe(II)-dependent formamide hydrolase-like protein
MEELTWMEVRDALRAGYTTAIIPTGGIEQNGPYLATGKHNIILKATAERIARKLGNALVTPVVGFVPEGGFTPPSGHMRYPGTISVSQETFKALVSDIAESLRTHRFEHVILIGDSGGNQEGLELVAQMLSKTWQGSGTSIHYIPEYYDNPLWSEWLKDQGVREVDEGLHDDVRHSAIMLSVDPTSVRMEQRIERGLFSINGVDLTPVDRMLDLADRLIDYQAEVTVDAIERRIGVPAFEVDFRSAQRGHSSGDYRYNVREGRSFLRMIGRFADRRATSTNPAFWNADARPVQANASAIFASGSFGYPSTAGAPCCRAKSTAALRSFTETPRPR